MDDTQAPTKLATTNAKLIEMTWEWALMRAGGGPNGESPNPGEVWNAFTARLRELGYELDLRRLPIGG